MPSKTLKTITRYRHMAIVTYDPTAANGSAEAARADWRTHRASRTRHVGRETPTCGIRACHRLLSSKLVSTGAVAIGLQSKGRTVFSMSNGSSNLFKAALI